MDLESLKSILDQEVAVAVGCTEPVAIALTSAAAMAAVGGEPLKLEMTLGVGVNKNARAVGIPGTTETGVELAAALGLAISKPEAGLEILGHVDPAALQRAKDILQSIELGCDVDFDRAGVYVRCRVVTTAGEAVAETAGRHDSVCVLSVNGERLPCEGGEAASQRETLRQLGSFEKMLDVLWDAPAAGFVHLVDKTRVNLELAEWGIKAGLGMGIGRCSNGAVADHATLAAAACDARMAGVQKPVCTCAGSGNQGISATVPLLSAAQAEKVGEERLGKCLALSLLATVYVKEHFGLLSPVCGCAVAAGAGSAAGLAMLWGGDRQAAEAAASAVLATLAGMLCDGGKVGCAMKVWTAVSTAEQSARFALAGGKIPAGNGIVGRTINDTLLKLERVARDGMGGLDRAIVAAMC